MLVRTLCLAAGAAVSAALPPSPEAAALQASVIKAIAARTSLTIPAGDYYFHDSALNISGAAGIAIGGAAAAGESVTLYFAPGFGVAVANATDLVLHDTVIDYSPLPYVHGAVTAANASSITVALDASSLTFEQFAAQYPPHDIWPPVSVFDGATADLIDSVCSWGSPPVAKLVSGRVYTVACNGGRAQSGDVLVAPTRVGFTLTLSYTARVTVRDVTIHAASYMAVTEFQGGGGNVYERLKLVPRNASAPLASNADGFHSSGMARGPTLQSAQMHGLLDDFFNVHSTFQLVVASGAQWLLLGDYQLFPDASRSNTLYGTQTTLDRAAPGDALSWYPLNTFSYPPLGTGEIAAIDRLDGPDAPSLLAAAYANASTRAVSTPCSACHAGLNAYATAQLYNVTLTTPVVTPGGVPPLSLANLDAIAASDAVIADCAFSGSGSNLGRFKSSHGRITGTVWRNTLSQNLEIEPLQNWLEGALGVHNVTVADNVFHGTSASPIHTFGAADVIQRNNSFLPTATKR